MKLALHDELELDSQPRLLHEPEFESEPQELPLRLGEPHESVLQLEGCDLLLHDEVYDPLELHELLDSHDLDGEEQCEEDDGEDEQEWVVLHPPELA